MKVKVTIYYGNSREEKHYVSFVGYLEELDTEALRWFAGMDKYLYTVISPYNEITNK